MCETVYAPADESDADPYFWTRDWSHIATYLVVAVLVVLVWVMLFKESLRLHFKLE